MLRASLSLNVSSNTTRYLFICTQFIFMELFTFKFEIIIATVLAIWCGILFISLIYNFCAHQADDQIVDKSILITALCNFLGWCLCFAINALLKTNSLLTILPIPASLIFRIYILYCPLYGIAFVSSYLFVIAMLYQSFKSSEFQITRCFMSMHITISILLLFSSTTATVFKYIVQHHLAGPLTFINVVIYVIGLCTMIYTLNLKLIKMMMMSNTKNTRRSPHCPSQSKLLQTVTKLTLLQTIFTITAVTYIVTSVLNHLVFRAYFSQIMDWLIYAVTVQIGTLCIYLTFNFNDSQYNMCCFACNRCCTKFCEWFIHKLYGSEIMMNRIESMRRSTMSVIDLGAVQRDSMESKTRISRISSVSTRSSASIISATSSPRVSNLSVGSNESGVGREIHSIPEDISTAP